MQNLATELDAPAIDAITDGLTQALSETVVTTMLAQNFHWNVTGMAFGPLHDLFQEIYEDHFAGQDDLAERIKALDAHAEGRLSAHLERSKVAEHDGHASDREMIQMLLDAERTVSGTLNALADVAEKNGDLLTQDLAIERGRIHEKFAWMLRAHLK